MGKRTSDRSDWQTKRQLHFQATPEGADTAEAATEQVEKVDTVSLGESVEKVDSLGTALDDKFDALLVDIDQGNLPDDEKNELKEQLVFAPQRKLLNDRAALLNNVGSKVNKNAAEIALGEENLAALPGLKTAVGGIEAGKLKTELEKSRIAESTEKAIAYTSAATGFTARVTTQAAAQVLGHSLRAIGTVFSIAFGKKK